MEKKISGYWKKGRIVCQPRLYAEGLSRDVSANDRVYVVGLAISFVVAAVEEKGEKVYYTPVADSVVAHEPDGKTESEQQLERSWGRDHFERP